MRNWRKSCLALLPLVLWKLHWLLHCLPMPSNYKWIFQGNCSVHMIHPCTCTCTNIQGSNAVHVITKQSSSYLLKWSCLIQPTSLSTHPHTQAHPHTLSHTHVCAFLLPTLTCFPSSFSSTFIHVHLHVYHPVHVHVYHPVHVHVYMYMYTCTCILYHPVHTLPTI